MTRTPSSPPQGANGGAERWVSVEEAAAHVGVRKDSIYRWIESRGLPATKIGKLWKLRLSEIDSWVRAGGARSLNNDPADRPNAPVNGLSATTHTSTILIVDDDENTRETLRDVVEDQGYIALTAGDGIDALRILRADDQPRPDLILLDLGLPKMDGLEVLAEQKRDPTIAAIPVIIITAERSRGVPESPVLRKPLDIGKLIDAMRGAISR